MEKINYKIIIKALKNNKIGVIPTDTVFGLVACYDNEIGIQRISIIKKRSLSKLMPIIVANQEQRNKLVTNAEGVDEFLLNETRPTTIIYQQKIGILPTTKIWTTGKIGIRIVQLNWLKKILLETGPLVATSLNNPVKWSNLNQEKTVEFIIPFVDFVYSENEHNFDCPASQIFDWTTKNWIRS